MFHSSGGIIVVVGPHEGPAAQIQEMLQKANPTTLSGYTQTLGVAIVHALPHHSEHSAWEIARLLVEQYRKSGWVPATLTVGPNTPVEMVLRPDASLRPVSEINMILAEMLSEFVSGVDLRECSAIGFSGENTALGHTFLSVLAARPTVGETSQGAEEAERSPGRIVAGVGFTPTETQAEGLSGQIDLRPDLVYALENFPEADARSDALIAARYERVARQKGWPTSCGELSIEALTSGGKEFVVIQPSADDRRQARRKWPLGKWRR